MWEEANCTECLSDQHQTSRIPFMLSYPTWWSLSYDYVVHHNSYISQVKNSHVQISSCAFLDFIVTVKPWPHFMRLSIKLLPRLWEQIDDAILCNAKLPTTTSYLFVLGFISDLINRRKTGCCLTWMLDKRPMETLWVGWTLEPFTASWHHTCVYFSSVISWNTDRKAISKSCKFPM